MVGAAFLAGLEGTQSAFCSPAQTNAGRLIYSTVCDSVLPKAVVGKLKEKFHVRPSTRQTAQAPSPVSTAPRGSLLLTGDHIIQILTAVVEYRYEYELVALVETPGATRLLDGSGPSVWSSRNCGARVPCLA